MVLPAILDSFAEEASATVMTRLALDWIIDETVLDELFDEVAEDQTTREFTLGHFVQVMLDVASGTRPSPRAAFLRRRLDDVASISAFYRKLARMELGVTAAVVRQTATRARELIVAAGGLLPEPIPGYAARVLDGNILTGTDHRIAPLRETRSASLADRRPFPETYRPVALRDPDAGVPPSAEMAAEVSDFALVSEVEDPG